jgi:hypothetical protein
MKSHRWGRGRKFRLAPLALSGLLILFGSSSQVRAQEAPPDPSGGGEVRVFDGYFVAGLFAFAALFSVAKTARRG